MRTNRIVVITGAAGGMGSVITDRFLANGDTVIAIDNSASSLEAFKASRQAVETLTTALADVSSEADCTRIADIARHLAGRVDVVVNCAGQFPIQPFEEMTLSQWRHVIDVNLTGAFLVIRSMLPLLKGRGWGRIVNIGSASIYEGQPGQAHYVAAKAGITGLSRSLARELGEHGITVNVVTPGLTVTPPVRDNFPAEMLEKGRSTRCLKRDETAEDLVGAVFFLASPDADFMTGQMVNVDGGNTMH